jgi:hypothetical protein
MLGGRCHIKNFMSSIAITFFLVDISFVAFTFSTLSIFRTDKNGALPNNSHLLILICKVEQGKMNPQFYFQIIPNFQHVFIEKIFALFPDNFGFNKAPLTVPIDCSL